MEQSSKRWGLLLAVVAVVLILGGGFYFFFGGKQKYISPVPVEPSFKVIYYTPTPAIVIPSSTPSATPKVKAVPTKPAPTKAEASPTVTPKATATPTP